MKQISVNPFRIIGLLADCSEKDIQKQKSRINALLSVGKDISSEYDFNALGHLKRSEDDINTAFSKIEQSENKLNYGLFWFVNGNHLDEVAFNYLKGNNIEKAKEIWQKSTQTSEISEKNYSIYNNLGTLNLYAAFSSNSIIIEFLSDAIKLKTLLIESELFSHLAHKIAGPTLHVNRKELKKHFAENLLNELTPYFKTGYSLSTFFEGIKDCDQEVISYLSSKLTDQPIHEIELSIEQGKKKRKEFPVEGFRIGSNLYTSTKDKLSILKTLLGSSNMQYQVIADNLAKEILQCGIDYFQEFRDSDTVNPYDDAIKLFKIAKSMAVGNQSKERINENISGLDEWNESKPERDKQNKIADDLLFVTSKLESFQSQADTVANAKGLVVSCKPRLVNIKSTLGAYDDFYLTVSSAVVNNAQGMLVAAVNKAQEGLSHAYDNTSKLVVLSRLKTIMTDAIEATNLMGTLDMTTEVRTRYNSNKNSLSSLKNQIDAVSAPRSTGSSGSSGCYIATMAYGSYDHPQVIILRKFRDNTLSKSFLGKVFIKIYYKCSPVLVKYLSNKSLANKVIRTILDKTIKLVNL